MNNAINIFRKILFIAVLFAIPVFIYSQNLVKIGNELFKKHQYCEAKKYYSKYLERYTNKKVYLKRGICNYHCNNLDLAIEDLQNARLLENYDDDLFLYLAKSYHAKQEFGDAIVYYKKYLSYLGKNRQKRKIIIDEIKRCAQGVNMQYKKSDHFIENWGAEINTADDDFLPLQSPNNNRNFYFSSNRDYGSVKNNVYKVFQVEYVDGNWEKLYNIFSPNSLKHTVFLDFTHEGKDVYYYQGNNFDNGDILVSDYRNSGNKLEHSYKINGPLNDKSGFKYLYHLNDSTVVFSSNKLGGFGGFDLFITGKRDGKWFFPVNLGAKINTAYDEISPFITKDGLMLYFSSNNQNSVGGFDIFKSRFSYSGDDWMMPENIGLPANSSADEYGFRMLNSGKAGVFNSNRKDKGFGKIDIYWIYFKKYNEKVIAYNDELPFLKNRHLSLIETREVVNVPVKKDKVISKPKPKKETVVTNKPKSNTKPKNNVKPKNKYKKDFIIPLLLVKNDKLRNKNITTEFVDKLAKLMVEYPQLKVELVGNVFHWQKDSTELLSSVKVVETLADSLSMRMINPAKILIKGVGDSYPGAKPNGPARSKNIITKINNRIDVYIHNKDAIPYNFKNENMYISKSLEDPRHKLYETVVEGLTYKIQIKKADFLFLNDLQNKYPDSSIEKDLVSNQYYYMIGLFKKYSNAKELYNRLLQQKITGLKVIPYIDGERISKEDILGYAKQYLDLVNYMEDNKDM